MSEPNGKFKLIAKKVIFALADLSQQTKTKIASVKGELGSRLLEHQENSNLHLPAAKAIFKLDGMDPDKRSLYLQHFDAYRGQFEERWAGEGHVGNMVDKAEQEADEEEQRKAAERKAAEKNGKAIKNGISQLPPDGTEAAAGEGSNVTKIGSGSKKKGMPGAEGRATH